MLRYLVEQAWHIYVTRRERVNNSRNETNLICNDTLFISIQHREEQNRTECLFSKEVTDGFDLFI